MHRRTLILRRFSAISFGLGYDDAGTWVDHTALPDRGRDLAIAGVSSAADRAAIHAMLSCCGQGADGQVAQLTAIPIRPGSARTAQIMHALATDVDDVARRSSAR